MNLSNSILFVVWWFTVIGGTTLAFMPNLETRTEKPKELFCGIISVLAVLLFPLPLVVAIFKDSWVPKDTSQIADTFKARVAFAFLMPFTLAIAPYSFDKAGLWCLMIYVAFIGNVFICLSISKMFM